MTSTPPIRNLMLNSGGDSNQTEGWFSRPHLASTCATTWDSLLQNSTQAFPNSLKSRRKSSRIGAATIECPLPRLRVWTTVIPWVSEHCCIPTNWPTSSLHIVSRSPLKWHREHAPILLLSLPKNAPLWSRITASQDPVNSTSKKEASTFRIVWPNISLLHWFWHGDVAGFPAALTKFNTKAWIVGPRTYWC